jgi:hypothetical protein
MTGCAGSLSLSLLPPVRSDEHKLQARLDLDAEGDR